MALLVKNLPANAGDARDSGLILELGRHPEIGNGKPIPVFLPGVFHGQRSLAEYSPWGRKESVMTEHACARAHTHTHTHTITLCCFVELPSGETHMGKELMSLANDQ